MFTALFAAARRLDTWLQARAGRPYGVLLSIGLVSEIVKGLTELPKHLAGGRRRIWLLPIMATNVALLIHQMGSFSHRLEARHTREVKPPHA